MDHSLKFAQEWIDAWNSRDLERVLALYGDNAEMVSPNIIKLGINAEGSVRGKDNLRAYWSRALAGNRDLQFKLLEVFASPDSIVVRYRNQKGHTVCEYLRVNRAGLIVQGSAHHLT
jgi:ketosteroid isomerase-like protein